MVRDISGNPGNSVVQGGEQDKCAPCGTIRDNSMIWAGLFVVGRLYADDATKDLNKKIARLQQAIDRSSAPNPRGATRAPSTKKKNAGSPHQRTSRKAADPADASDNDTSTEKGKKKKNVKRTQSPKKRNQPSKNSAARKKK